MDPRTTAQKHCDELLDELSRAIESRRTFRQLFEVPNGQESAARRDLLNQVGSFFTWLQLVTFDHVVLVLSRMNDRASSTVSFNSLGDCLRKVWTTQQCAEFKMRHDEFSTAVNALVDYRNDFIGHRSAVAVFEKGQGSVPLAQIEPCIELATRCIDAACLLLQPDTQRLHDPLWLGDGDTVLEVIRNSQTLFRLQILALDEGKRDLIIQRLRDRTGMDRLDFESIVNSASDPA